MVCIIAKFCCWHFLQVAGGASEMVSKLDQVCAKTKAGQPGGQPGRQTKLNSKPVCVSRCLAVSERSSQPVSLEPTMGHSTTQLPLPDVSKALSVSLPQLLTVRSLLSLSSRAELVPLSSRLSSFSLSSQVC